MVIVAPNICGLLSFQRRSPTLVDGDRPRISYINCSNTSVHFVLITRSFFHLQSWIRKEDYEHVSKIPGGGDLLVAIECRSRFCPRLASVAREQSRWRGQQFRSTQGMAQRTGQEVVRRGWKWRGVTLFDRRQSI